MMIKVKDEMDNPIVPTSPSIGTKVDLMQDIPENASELDSGSIKYVEHNDTEDKEIDLTQPKYNKVIELLSANGYSDSKFLGNSGYLVSPQPRDDLRLICKSLKEGFSVIYEGEVFPSGYFKYVNLANDLNAILSDATTAKTKDRHINEYYGYGYDTESEEGLWVAQADIDMLTRLHDSCEKQFVLIKSKMIKDIVISILNDIGKTVDESPLASEIIHKCDNLLSIYGGDQDA